MISVFRFALHYARRHWLGLSALVVLAVIAAVVAAAVPWPLRYAVDDVLGPEGSQDATQLILAAIALVGVLVLAQVVVLVQRRLEVSLSRAVTVEVGADLFDRLQQVSLTDARRYRVGDVVARVTRDASAAQNLILAVGVSTLQQGAYVVVYTFLLWRLDPLSGAIAWGIAIGQAVVARRFAGPTDRATQRRARAEAELMATVDNSLEGLDEIWVNGAIEREVEHFETVASETFEAARRTDTVLLRFGLNTSLLGAVGNGLVLLVGVQRVFSGELTVGDLLVILAYVQALQGPVEGLAYAIPNAAGASAKARRVTEFLADADRVTVTSPVVVLPEGGVDVVFRGVGYAYGEERVVDGVSLTASAGTVTALVGPTGAGKSTLVSLLPRLIDPVVGSITINGVDHRRIPLGNLRQLIAVVRQDPYLFPASLRDNIAYGRPDASLEEIVAAARAANAHEFIEALPDGYETVVGDGGAGLSGGQRQRLAIARALLKDAPVLVLDEPTSALDAGTEAEVMDAIDRLVEGRTVLVIAHRLSTIRNADTIVVLDHGTVAEAGTHQELLAAGGLYHTLYTTQFQDHPVVP